MKLISNRRIFKILKRVYRDCVEIPVCAFGVRYEYFTDNTLKTKIGTAFYLDLNKNYPTRKQIEKAYGKYQFQTDSVVNFELNSN